MLRRENIWNLCQSKIYGDKKRRTKFISKKFHLINNMGRSQKSSFCIYKDCVGVRFYYISSMRYFYINGVLSTYHSINMPFAVFLSEII